MGTSHNQKQLEDQGEGKMTVRYFIFFLSFGLLASSALGCTPKQTVRPCPPGTPAPADAAFCTSCGPIVASGAGSWYLDFSGRNCCCCPALTALAACTA